jgi:uncharacterized protein
MANYPKFEIFKGINLEFYFRLRASNGENILSSEGYSAKENAIRGIESVVENSADIASFHAKIASNNKYYFVLKAKNGQIIGSSQMYSSAENRDNGIKSVMGHASKAEIEYLNE